MSLASFLAILGYEAARLHDGSDPALAKVKSAASKSKQSTTSSQQSTTGTQDDSGYNGGQDYSGGNQGYYTPPATDSPSTGSS